MTLFLLQFLILAPAVEMIIITTAFQNKSGSEEIGWNWMIWSK